VPSREWRYKNQKKIYQVMKVSFKVQKKGMGLMNKKVGWTDLNFGPVVLNK
jgi:hypothetical protein